MPEYPTTWPVSIELRGATTAHPEMSGQPATRLVFEWCVNSLDDRGSEKLQEALRRVLGSLAKVKEVHKGILITATEDLTIDHVMIVHGVGKVVEAFRIVYAEP